MIPPLLNLSATLGDCKDNNNYNGDNGDIDIYSGGNDDDVTDNY